MKLGIIGGSGLYDMEGIEDIRREKVDTPFGDPSDEYIAGKLAGKDVFFLPRHGRGHRLLPSEINHQANIYGFKVLGVDRVISVSAVGSLKEEMRPRDVVLSDQYFDRTKNRMGHTFFGEGLVAHVSFGEPCCENLRKAIAKSCEVVIGKNPKCGSRIHVGGTYVNMEGPAFSTKAESRFYRAQGFDIIGMTSLAEAKLCREAEICYQPMSMVTDYDCWHESEEAVTVDMVVAHLQANTRLAKDVLVNLLASLPDETDCSCGQSLKYALLTAKELVPASTLEKLMPIVGKYFE